MALIINQSPTSSVNASNSDILYVVTSISASNISYQYVCDVLDENDERVVRIKQRPNPSGVGVFNLGRIIHKNIYGDAGEYNVDMFKGATNNIGVYKIKFGEEWATSLVGASKLYNGEGALGDPIVSASLGEYTYFTGITLNRNSSTSSFLEPLPYFQSSSTAGDVNVALTSIPRQKIPIREGDYHTVAFFNGPIDETLSEVNDIYRVEFNYYDGVDGGGSLISSESFTNTSFTDGGTDAPRASTGTALPTAPFFGAKYFNRVTYVQVGANYLTIPANTLSYTADIQNLAGDYYDKFTFNLSQEEGCPYPFYRLMWINEFGNYDYFNFEGRNQYNNSRTDTQYGRGFINYSIQSEGTNPYNIENRGIKNSFTEQKQRVKVTTKFLTLDWANYLEGLFVSSDVWLIEGDRILPIALISADYKKFNDPRSEKQRSYTIEFEYANPKRPY